MLGGIRNNKQEICFAVLITALTIDVFLKLGGGAGGIVYLLPVYCRDCPSLHYSASYTATLQLKSQHY